MKTRRVEWWIEYKSAGHQPPDVNVPQGIKHGGRGRVCRTLSKFISIKNKLAFPKENFRCGSQNRSSLVRWPPSSLWQPPRWRRIPTARRRKTNRLGLLPSLPAGPRWIMDAIALRRDGGEGTHHAEEHHARYRPANAVSPVGRALLPLHHRRSGTRRILCGSRCALRCLCTLRLLSK